MSVSKKLQQVLAQVQKAVSDTLAGEVLAEAQVAVVQNVETVVYGRYTPQEYERRGDNGGLSDMGNVVGTMVSPTHLQVTNITPPNPVNGTTDKDLTATVEEGLTYNYDYYNPGNRRHDYWASPRPFMAHAADELREDGRVKDALVAGLRAQGYDAH